MINKAINDIVEIIHGQSGQFYDRDAEWLEQYYILCKERGINQADASWKFLVYARAAGIDINEGDFPEWACAIGSSIYESVATNCESLNLCEESATLQQVVSRNEEMLMDDDVFLMPEQIYAKLPGFLREMCSLYKLPHERDMMLLSALTALSSMFPNCSGVYDKRRFSINLYTVIVAPPGSGKGSIAITRRLGDAIQQMLDENYEVELQVHNEAVEQAKAEGNTRPVVPKPGRKILFLPANITTARLIECMARNRNFGIIMDTEADTLTQALKSQHGGFSDLLRKVFQNETVEASRKLNDEHYAIAKPSLSVLLTGTESQVEPLFNNVGNGLDTRFLFYQSAGDSSWRNVFEQQDLLPELAFKAMATELGAFTQRLQSFNPNAPEIEFHLTPQQQELFHERFVVKNSQVLRVHGEEFLGSLRRLGLSLWRVAATLSMVRAIDSACTPNVVVCNDDDFQVAMALIECLTTHSSKVFMSLQSARAGTKKQQRKNEGKLIDQFWLKLPTKFLRKESLEYAALLGINQKTSGNYLDKFIQQGRLDRVSHGMYCKL